MERGTGFEPATICLEGRDSTPELPPLIPNQLGRPQMPLESAGPIVFREPLRIWSLGPGLNR
jgi:hypothetical protein